MTPIKLKSKILRTSDKKKKHAVTKKKTIKTDLAQEKVSIPIAEKNIVKKEYVFCVGRRKSAVARVRYYKKGNGKISINGKDLNAYFPIFEERQIVAEPIKITNFSNTGDFSVKVTGGGVRGQAYSIQLGISRILVTLDASLKPILKSKNLLVRDSRVKERKKYGLKKARRAPQWQKR
ncbi:MAG: 30S ribosomal protein S9 [Patescibacteria group bacterium]|jgi:small subunit ribosomal protein S9